MKLNVRRTALLGLAFMAICAFWGLYDFAVPLILKNTYKLGDTAAGVVMAMDNIVALVLLPVFGGLSDRCRSPLGRRMPFILVGATTAAALTLLVPPVVKSAPLWQFLTLLALLLITMGTFRSPAVALMPDVTPKPLRSRGNAIINLMGAIGGALSLVMVNFLVRKVELPEGGTGSDYTLLFVAVAVILAGAAWVVKMCIPERKLAAEAEAINRSLDEQEQDVPREARSLSRGEKRSLALILVSVSLWFMGYNAVSTAFSKYAMAVLQVPEALAANCMLVATVAAIASYWPMGMLSSRFGRKRMILFGVALLLTAFAAAAFMTTLNALAFVLFALVGIGWATISVNSYPMVVELASGSDVGRYTGYYYTFSMAAQVLTPVLSGALMEHVSLYTLFPYAAAMMALALVTMSLVRHGDSKPEARRGLEALNVDD